MHSMKFNFTRIAFACLLLTVGLASMASAQPPGATSTFRFFVDADPAAIPTTGCMISTTVGTSLSGIDQIVTVVVNTGSSPAISTTSRQVCSGGVFNPASSPAAAMGPVPGPPGNLSTIETSAPLASLPSAAGVRVYFDSIYSGNNSPQSRDELLTLTGTPLGGGIIVQLIAGDIPTLSEWGLILLALLLSMSAFVVMRRRGEGSRAAAGLLLVIFALGAGVAWAAITITVDGNPGDWAISGVTSATDVNADAQVNADIVKGYGVVQVDSSNMATLFLRTDVRLTGGPLTNNPPVVNPATFSIAENSANGTNVGTVTFTDPDAGQTHTFAITAGNLGSAFAINAATGQITVASSTALDFETTPTFSLTVQVTDNGTPVQSGTGTITVNLTNVNEAPVVQADTFTVGEDAAVGSNVGTVAFTDSDLGQTHTFAITAGNTGGAFAINSSTGQITVAAPLNAATNPTYALTVQVTDNGTPALSGSATITVNVTDVNHTPVVNPATFSLAENSPNATSVGTVTFTDSDAGQTHTFAITAGNTGGAFAINSSTGEITVANSSAVDFETNPTFSLTVQVTDNGSPALSGSATITVNLTDVNEAPVANAQSVTTSEDTPLVITLTGSDADADPLTFAVGTGPTNGTLSAITPINATSAQVTYTPGPNFNGADSFTFTVNDGTATSVAATVSITVSAINDAPVANAQSVTTPEDTPLVITLTGSDADGNPLTFASGTGPTNGTLSAITPINATSAQVTYTPGANFNGADSFTFTANDGTATSAAATVSITVNAVNDTPVANAQSVTTPEDTSLVITLTGSDADGNPLTFASGVPTNGTLSAITPINATSAQVTYTPNLNYNGADSFTFTVSDGTATSAAATVSITVNAVNDPPVANDDTAILTEDTPAAINVLANDTDVEGDPFSIAAIVTPPANGTVALTPAGPGPYTGLTYTPNANYCNTQPGGVPDTFTYSLTPGGDTATVSVTVTCVPDPPSCTATPTYTTAGNTQLHVAGATLPGVASVSDSQSLLTKGAPTDPDSPGPFTVIPASGNTGGGDWVINADGSFTFVPNAGFTGTATRTFQVSDNGTPAAIGTCMVNVSVPNEVVWYVRDVVDANNAAGGDGRSTNAFEALASAQSPVSGTGHYIYVFEGGTATTPHVGGFALADGQKLWGQGVDLDLPSFPNLVTATNKARVRATTASVNSVNVPATGGNRLGVEIRGLDLEATGATSNAIDVTSSGANQVGVTISDNNIRGATAEGIDLNSGGTGAFSATVQTNTVTAAGNGIDARVSGTGTATVTASSNMITSTAGNAFDARTLAGASALRVALDNSNVAAAGNGIVIDGSAAGATTITSFSNNVVNGSTVGTGINITSATFDGTPGGTYNNVSGGTTVVGASGNGVGGSGINMSNVAGDLAFADLDIFADGGAGLRITGTGAVNVGAGTGTRVTVGTGVAIFEATGGPAVDVTNATVDLQPTSIKSTNSSTTGVSLVNVSDGTTPAVFSVVGPATSAITTAAGATGPTFNVSGGNADISYAGTITNNSTSARAVSLTTWSGDDAADDITLSGAIDENGAGILVNGNGGSRPITFSGGMDIDTTTGEGFAATSNTNTLGLHITGTNTIDSVSATALRVTNTTIGSSNLTFQHISSGNNTAAADPANGIVLNTTGTLGSLIVTGTGAADSGGTIQNMTGDGILMTSTRGPSFTRMKVQNTAGSGVKGTQVTNFTFVNGTVDNSGTGLGAETSNIAFNTTAAATENNLDGTVTITGNTLTNAYYHGIDIFNFNGTIADAVISNNTITSSNSTATSKGTGIRLVAFGSATTVANVTKATISNNIVSNFPSANGILVSGGNGNAAGPAGVFGTAGSGTNVIAITGNRVAGFSPAVKIGAFAIGATVNGKGQGNFDISGNGTAANPITNVIGAAISLGSFGQAVVTSNINNNVIVANNQAGAQGIGAGTSSTFGASDTPSLTVTITGNNVSQTDGNGILVTARDATGTVRAKIQNNTVAAPLGGNRNGIRVDAGNAISINDSVCLNISGNTSAGVGLSPEGIGIRKQGTVAGTNNFALHGFATSPANQAQTAAYVTSQNPGSASGTLIISGDNFNSPTCSFP